MITPSQFRTAVRDAVLAALPVARQDTTAVNWSGGARELADQRLLLDVVSEVEAYDRETLHPLQILESVLDVTVQVRAESTYDTADSDALDLLNDVRYGLRRTSVYDALHALDITQIGQAGPTRNVSYRASQRLVSSHAFEVTYRAAFGLMTDEAGGLIEHVDWSGTVADNSDTVQIGPVVTDDPEPSP